MPVKRKAIMHVEGVPNPSAMKFVLENGILTDQPYEFQNHDDARHSPLAQKLLMLRYVDRVYLNYNYITLLKNTSSGREWDEILPDIKALIVNHLEQDEAILYVEADAMGHPGVEDDVIANLICQLLDKDVRPAAQEDGGDILFESYHDGVLNVSMHGACHSCPYASQTLKEGVEKLMAYHIPEVRKVIARENGVEK